MSVIIFVIIEMIVESRPLHKKKKRLAKQRSLRELQTSPSCEQVSYISFACVSAIGLQLYKTLLLSYTD